MAWGRAGVRGEDGTAVGVVGAVQAAAEIADDAGRHGQPEAEPVAGRLGGEEGFEQMGLASALRPGPWSRTRRRTMSPAHSQASSIAAGAGRPWRRGVADQVDQHLLQAVGVAQRHGLVGRAAAHDLGAGPAQAGSSRARALSSAWQGDRGRLAARFAGEVAQLAGDAAHAVDQVGDAAEVGARGVDIAAFQKRSALADRVRSAASGWFSSWAMPVDSWPMTASLPACTSSSWAARSVRSARMRSPTSSCSWRLAAEVGGALLDLAFQLVVRLLQGFAGGQPVAQVAPPFVEDDAEQAQAGGDGGQRGAALGEAVDLLEMRQHGQRPRRAGQGARLFEEAAGDRVDRDAVSGPLAAMRTSRAPWS
jgi:hypothetical protein